ncbi:MAG TPA: hypothetical protein VMI75_37300 [Polyangiaceae bacterium]|nr:hypothetical protein [Polyangiaceae bacterium]
MSNFQKSPSELGVSSPGVAIARVTKVDMTAGSSTGIAHATDSEGREFMFAGHWRPMMTIADALREGYEIDVWLDGWTILCFEAVR